MTIWNTTAEQAVADLTGSIRIVLSLRAITQSKIPDLISQQPQTAEALARQTELDAGSLERVMRFLSDEGLIECDSQGRYSNTEITRLFRSDIADSLRTYLLFRTDSSMLSAWMGLPDVLKSGEPAFEKANGAPMFQYFKEKAELADLFNNFMNKMYGGEGKRIADGYDFGQFGSVVDIGGGIGHVLAEILRTHQGVSGALYEPPAVAEAATNFLSQQDVAGRAKIIAGDFFERVPEGYDAYFVKSVLHDWNDEEVKKILTNCRNVMADNARILIAEQVPSTTRDLYPDRFVDLEMIVVTGGMERRLDQFDALLKSASLALVECHAIPDSSFKIIEAKPAPLTT